MATMRTVMVMMLLASPLAVSAVKVMRAETMAAANPIRKVVTMLQNMEKKVIAEGESEKELFDKFMCYCKTASGDLSASIGKAGDKLDTLPTEIEEKKDNLKAKKESLKKNQVDRSTAKQVLAEATAMREKEEKEFTTTKGEYDTNIAAIGKAVAAIESGGASSAFLQTGVAQKLKQVFRTVEWQSIQDDDRVAVNSFLQGKSAGPAGAITGILKQMGDEMTSDLADATKTEKKAIEDFEGLTAAKTKEMSALTKSIEKKIKEIGDLGVEVVQMEADLGDTAKGLEEDKKFIKDLAKNCKTKTAEWEEICKQRTLELSALADTIKILNDDDALEMFKKTLPGSSASFLQLQVTSAQMRQEALSVIRKARASQPARHRQELDLIAISLSGKKIDMSKVIAMIDDMVVLLKKEQSNDDAKKEYCEKELDLADDKKKVLEKGEKDAAASIATATKGIEVAADEIKGLTASIADTDAKVKEATVQRKAENVEYKELVASDTAAKEILKFAKNRLNKFYNPSQYKASLAQAAPPPPPEAPSAHKPKGEESTGVIAMIDTLIADLDKELQIAEAEEKNAQGDYETFVEDSADKRTEESQNLMDKEKAKADMEVELETQTGLKKDIVKELYATHKYIDSLHKECDFLLDFYKVRTEARATEIKAMTDAKAVLSGAGSALIQTAAHHYLRH